MMALSFRPLLVGIIVSMQVPHRLCARVRPAQYLDGEGKGEHQEKHHQELHEGLAVHGHTALERLRVLSLKADNDGKCKKVLNKVVEIAEKDGFRKEINEKRDPELAGAEVQLIKDIKEQWEGEEILDEVEDVINGHDLSSIMKTGQVITAADINLLVECAGGFPRATRLEEWTHTREGDPILQGDMVQPASGDGELSKTSLLELENAIKQGQRWAGTPWNKNKIYYCVQTGTSARAQKAWHKALAHIKEQIPCLKFQDVGAYSKDKCNKNPAIMLQSSDRGCWSYVGNIGWTRKSQPLNLGRGCEYMGIAAHEIGHAIGMAHEQSRPDRDGFVEIHWQNMPNERDTHHQFEIDRDAYVGTGYDAYSLMHYDAYAFSSNGRPTITAKDNRRMTHILGQREGFSELDVMHIGKMYKCQVFPLMKNMKEAMSLIGEKPPAPKPTRPSGGRNTPQPTGQLAIVIESARDLPEMRFGATPDPYCNMYINGKKLIKTPVIDNSFHPTWKGRFSLRDYDGKSALEFKVKDASWFGPAHGTILGHALLEAEYFYPEGNYLDIHLKTDMGNETLTPRLRVCIGVCYTHTHGCGCENI